jgi:ABC-type multidrug transport system fused ATPase/permease subunit
MNEMKTVSSNMLRLARYLRPYWKQQVLSLVFLVVGTASSLLIPLLVKNLIDVAIPALDVRMLAAIAFQMGGLHVLSVASTLFTDYFFLRVSNSILLDLRRDLHDHLLRLSMDYFERTKAGQISARVMGDVDAVQRLTTNAFLVFLTDSLAVIFMFVFMVVLSWEMTLIGLGSIVLLVIALRIFNARIERAARTSRESYAHISEDLYESVAGIKEIKAFTYERIKGRLFTNRLGDYFRASFRMGMWSSVSQRAGHLVVSIGPVLIYYFGGTGVVRGDFTIGMIVAFIAYLNYMYMSVYRLTDLNIQVHSAIGSVERIFEFIDTQPTVLERGKAVGAEDIRGEIELRNVFFAYGDPGSAEVLHNIDLRIEPGEKVALVGASGSGKSTIVHLICRFYDTCRGSVLIDGRDIRDFEIRRLRGHIGIVPQETYLFNASIAENIRLGKPDATMEEIEHVASLAQASEFIEEMPRGYESIVGERGTKLSGGQRQRLSIARTLLKNPAMVIFDEATSSLDSESERLVKESMERLMKGRTTLIVSHRLATVADAHRIIVLDEGEIVEEGTHASLMAKGGIYKRIYEHQSQAPDSPRA